MFRGCVPQVAGEPQLWGWGGLLTLSPACRYPRGIWLTVVMNRILGLAFIQSSRLFLIAVYHESGSNKLGSSRCSLNDDAGGSGLPCAQLSSAVVLCSKDVEGNSPSTSSTHAVSGMYSIGALFAYPTVEVGNVGWWWKVLICRPGKGVYYGYKTLVCICILGESTVRISVRLRLLESMYKVVNADLKL